MRLCSEIDTRIIVVHNEQQQPREFLRLERRGPSNKGPAQRYRQKGSCAIGRGKVETTRNQKVGFSSKRRAGDKIERRNVLRGYDIVLRSTQKETKFETTILVSTSSTTTTTKDRGMDTRCVTYPSPLQGVPFDNSETPWPSNRMHR